MNEHAEVISAYSRNQAIEDGVLVRARKGLRGLRQDLRTERIEHEMGTGNGKDPELTWELLTQIRDELREHGTLMREHSVMLKELNGRMNDST